MANHAIKNDSSRFMHAYFFLGQLVVTGTPDEKLRKLVKLLDKGEKNGFKKEFKTLLESNEEKDTRLKARALRDVIKKYIK